MKKKYIRIFVILMLAITSSALADTVPVAGYTVTYSPYIYMFDAQPRTESVAPGYTYAGTIFDDQLAVDVETQDCLSLYGDVTLGDAAAEWVESYRQGMLDWYTLNGREITFLAQNDENPAGALFMIYRVADREFGEYYLADTLIGGLSITLTGYTADETKALEESHLKAFMRFVDSFARAE